MTNILNKTTYIQEVKYVVPPSGPYWLCSHERQLTKAAPLNYRNFFDLEGTSSGSLLAYLSVVQLHHEFCYLK